MRLPLNVAVSRDGATWEAAAVLEDLHEQRRLCNLMEVSLPTLQRALNGDPVRGLSMRRIRRVLGRLGLLELLPAEHRGTV